MSAEQVHKNKSVLSDFYTGGVVPGMAGDNGGQRCRVPDLRPPDDPTGTFDDYLAHQVNAIIQFLVILNCSQAKF